MDNALLISLSRQITLRQQMNVIANNMANINTAGFKSDHLKFEEYIMPIAQMTENQGRDKNLSYVHTAGQFRNYSDGGLEQTGNQFDVALSGKGWLVAQTPDGERYTRNGQLQLNAQGQLITNQGYPILGDGGPITFTPEDGKVSIASDGTISTAQGQKGKLRVVEFASLDGLKKEGTSLYSSPQAGQPSTNTRVMQGMVERSNVQPIVEMTKMLETVRAYTNATQALGKAQELRSDAIEQLGQTGG